MMSDAPIQFGIYAVPLCAVIVHMCSTSVDETVQFRRCRWRVRTNEFFYLHFGFRYVRAHCEVFDNKIESGRFSFKP